MFERWEDGSTNSSRVIDVKSDMEITAYYKEVSEGMGKVTFTGSVSAQEKEGEIVTITVTKPDATTDIVTTPTTADLTFGPVDYENVVGDYKAKARIEADALYQAAESVEVPFSIGKEPRTIILTVV
jgi:hypothetical protein